jgi:hypothetical protein
MRVYLSFLFIVSAFITFSACKKNKDRYSDSGMQVIAKAYDKELKLTDIAALSAATTALDSQAIARRYAEDWAKGQIFLRNARDQLSMARQKQIDAKVEAYKQSLYIYEYEKSLISQKFDTSLSIAEIDSFVNQFPASFMLEEDIVRFCIIVNPPTGIIAQMRRWLQGGEYEQIRDYCTEQSLESYIEPETWTTITTFFGYFPEAPIQRLPNNEIVYLSSKNIRYLVQVLDLKKKGTPAPGSFIRDEVKSSLLQSKKAAFIEQLRKEMLQESVETNKVTFYK